MRDSVNYNNYHRTNKGSIFIQKSPMRNIIIASFLICIFISSNINAQSISPLEIINKSIKYHDPEGKLLKNNVELYLTETRPNGNDRKSEISFNIKKEKFRLKQNREEHEIVSSYDSGKVTFQFDGQKEYSKEVEEKFKLNGERVQILRSYYQYLWLMPVKLLDLGTNFNPSVKKVDFFGRESFEIRVTYDPDVGSDVWYFYFNPTTYALQGYRFYHDEEKNDGEYIILEDEVIHEKVRLPKNRKWYTNKDDKFLGADILEALTL